MQEKPRPLARAVQRIPHKRMARPGQMGADLMARATSLHEFNPMLGFRGCRLAIVYPEIYDMQARAVFDVTGAGDTVVAQLGFYLADGVPLGAAVELANHAAGIVVARLGDDVTVKRFQRKGSQVWLLPENEELSPIEVDLSSQHLTIEGLAVGVIRNADWM